MIAAPRASTRARACDTRSMAHLQPDARLMSGIVAVLLSTAIGCVPSYDATTEVRVRDPSRVAVRARSGETLLPEGSTPAKAPVAHGVYTTGPSSSSDYAVS